MPTYEYKCEECGIRFERIQHFSEEPLKVCPECSGPVHRVPCAVGIVFKGSGFYVTDHRGDRSSLMPKSKKDEASADKASSTEEPSKARASPEKSEK